MDYSALQQHIADQMGRTDLNAQIPLFIEMAEASMNRRLRVRDMVCPATVETSGKYINIPVQYLGLRSLRVQNGRQVTQVSPEVLQNTKMKYDSGCGSMPTQPLWYVELGNRLEIYPQADDTVFEIVFYERIPALTDSHPSNWVLQNHPDAYLTGAMTQYALLYARNNAEMPDWMGMHEGVIGQMEMSDETDRWSGGGLRVNV